MFYPASDSQRANRIRPDIASPLKGDPFDPPYDQHWDIELPANFSDDLNHKPWAHRNHRDIWNFLLGGPAPGDIEAWRRLQSYYFNCLRDEDAQLGVVLNELEASGQADRTIIIYTSDHGELGGAHGLREKGGVIYKENLNVPLIVCHPDVAGGRRSESLASALDLAPTVLGFAGLDDDDMAARHPDLKGIDLGRALGGTAAGTRCDDTGLLIYYGIMLLAMEARKARAAMEHALQTPPEERRPPPTDRPFQPLDDRPMIRGIHTGRHKFARYFAPAEHHRPADWETLTSHNDLELYDLDSDPQEMTNLAADADANKDLILDLNQRLNALIEREIGVDDGREFPGDGAHYNLAK